MVWCNHNLRELYIFGPDCGLVWKREDLAGDGTHPSQSGRQKVAELLLTFFKTSMNAKGWFRQSTN